MNILQNSKENYKKYYKRNIINNNIDKKSYHFI